MPYTHSARMARITYVGVNTEVNMPTRTLAGGTSFTLASGSVGLGERSRLHVREEYRLDT